MSFDQYLAMGHVVVRFGKMRVPSFDEWFFARFGVSRRVEVVAQSFDAVPQLLIGTQHIATMPPPARAGLPRHCCPCACCHRRSRFPP